VGQKRFEKGCVGRKEKVECDQDRDGWADAEETLQVRPQTGRWLEYGTDEQGVAQKERLHATADGFEALCDVAGPAPDAFGTHPAEFSADPSLGHALVYSPHRAFDHSKDVALVRTQRLGQYGVAVAAELADHTIRQGLGGTMTTGDRLDPIGAATLSMADQAVASATRTTPADPSEVGFTVDGDDLLIWGLFPCAESRYDNHRLGGIGPRLTARSLNPLR
jgi:hypothetical protein